MWAYFAKEPVVVVGQLTPCAQLQVCSRTTGGFMRHWMPDVHLMWSEGVAHLLNESCRLGSILKPVCGPRVHGSRHDGDPSIKKMPTSKKITNVVICHSSSTVPQKKNDGAFTMDATRHDGSMVVTSQIPSACLWIQKFALDHIMSREERHTKEFVMR